MSELAFIPDLIPQTPTVVETLVRSLRQAIMSGALAGGTPIRQEEMSRKFGVSRVPLREALLRLEGEGLVETQPRRGVVVTALSSEDFSEILEMRQALESLAIGLAAQKFTDAHLRQVLEIVDQADELLKKEGPLDLSSEFEHRWGALNLEFHRRLYAPANRPRLMTSIEAMHNLFARHVRVLIEGGVRFDDVQPSAEETLAANLAEWRAVNNEHRDMALACARHDADEAKRLLHHHISGHGAELLRRLRNSPSALTQSTARQG
jgi:DNA-binding GntR family transcriptional regulator